MSNWMKELNEEYPNYNTVGETWVTEPAYTAWWQMDSKLSADTVDIGVLNPPEAVLY